MIYKMLMPEFYDNIQLDQLLLRPEDLNDRFTKFFSSSFRLRTFQPSKPINSPSI